MRHLIAPALEERREGDIEIEDESDQEVESVKLSRDPGQPTEKEMEEHRCTHLPYRLWCKFCVMGRGRGVPHKHSPGSSIPIIGIDYFFMTANGAEKNETVEQAEGADPEEGHESNSLVKYILIRCSTTNIVFATSFLRRALTRRCTSHGSLLMISHGSAIPRRSSRATMSQRSRL